MVEVNNKEIKYTFLLPAFKTPFLEEALLSIKNQTFKDFMVLVSDDCSPEPIKQIFDKVVGDDSRFSYRRNEENMGAKSLVSHWNLLVDMCDTEYLIMASDDDVYETSFLEEIDKLVKKYPTVDLFRARAKRIENGKIVREDFNLDEFMSYAKFLTTFSRPDMVSCLANYVFRTKKLKKYKGFPDFPTAAKSDVAAAMIMSRCGIVSTKDVLFSFRISTENLSSTQMYAKKAEQVLVANLMFTDWYRENVNKMLISDIDGEKQYLVPLIREAYKMRVENVSVFLLSHLSLRKRIRYVRKFWEHGLLTDRISQITPSIFFIVYACCFRYAKKVLKK